MNIVALIIQLVAGAIGGNAAGGALKQVSLGGIGNTVAGLLGGVGTGQLLGMLIPALTGAAAAHAGAPAAGSGGLDATAIIGQLLSGGVGGAVLTGVVGLIKNKIEAS
jgi:hypothetical protein